MYSSLNGRHSALPTDVPGFRKPSWAANKTLSTFLYVWISPAVQTSGRSSNRAMCLITALLLLHTFTTASWAQLPGTPTETSASATLAPLVRKIIPSVVSITAKEHAPVKHIYVDPESNQFPDAPYRSTDREAEGAGVVVDSREGFIVASAHVLEHASDISVTLSDGRRFQGSLVDADPNTDVALIRVAAAGLVALPMADSETLEVGDYLVAVGNPFGMEQPLVTEL